VRRRPMQASAQLPSGRSRARAVSASSLALGRLRESSPRTSLGLSARLRRRPHCSTAHTPHPTYTPSHRRSGHAVRRRIARLRSRVSGRSAPRLLSGAQLRELARGVTPFGLELRLRSTLSRWARQLASSLDSRHRSSCQTSTRPSRPLAISSTRSRRSVERRATEDR